MAVILGIYSSIFVSNVQDVVSEANEGVTILRQRRFSYAQKRCGDGRYLHVVRLSCSTLDHKLSFSSKLNSFFESDLN